MQKIQNSIFGNGLKDASEEILNKYWQLYIEFEKYVNKKSTIPLFNNLKLLCNALITKS